MYCICAWMCGHDVKLWVDKLCIVQVMYYETKSYPVRHRWPSVEITNQTGDRVLTIYCILLRYRVRVKEVPKMLEWRRRYGRNSESLLWTSMEVALRKGDGWKKRFSSVPLPFLTVFLLRLLYRLQMQQQFFMAMIRANIAILSTTVAQTPTNASGSTYILTWSI